MNESRQYELEGKRLDLSQSLRRLAEQVERASVTEPDIDPPSDDEANDGSEQDVSGGDDTDAEDAETPAITATPLLSSSPRPSATIRSNCCLVAAASGMLMQPWLMGCPKLLCQ